MKDSWSKPFVEKLFRVLREQNRTHLFKKTFIFKEKVFVVDFSYHEIIFGFDIEVGDDGFLKVSFVQRNSLNEVGLLLGTRSKNQILADSISEHQALVLICATLSLTISKIDAYVLQNAPVPSPSKQGDGYSIYENAVIVPPRLLRPKVFDNAAGVFTVNGHFIDDCVTYSSGNARHGKPDFPGVENLPTLSGTHCYGGIFFGHFGHFITESTGRLWALGIEGLSPKSVLYVPKIGTDTPPQTSSKESLLQALGITTNISILTRPMIVERLIVPKAGFGLTEELIDGTPQYVSYMHRISGAQPAASGAEKLYISRRGLALDRGSFLGEALVEEMLEAEGYLIWSPQKYSAAEQIAQYRAAKMIISVDASPLHMYAYAANDEQKLAIIKRRSTDAYTNIVRHIKAFNSPEIHVLDELIADHVPDAGRVGRSSWGEVDIGRIGATLAKIGMIKKPKHWKRIDKNSVDDLVGILSNDAGTKYHRHVVS